MMMHAKMIMRDGPSTRFETSSVIAQVHPTANMNRRDGELEAQFNLTCTCM